MCRLIRCLTLVLIAGLLFQGCSTVRLGYGRADSLARWWIDEYLDLSPEQEALVRERLARTLAWHRKTQLPDYVTLLGQSETLVAGHPTPADALALGEGIMRRASTLAEHMIPDTADLLVTLARGQIERMASRLAERNAEYAREARLAEGESGQRKARYRRTLERIEYWFGDTTTEQRETLRQMIDGQPAGSQFWFEERQRRQRDWLTLVRQVQRDRPPRERIVHLLRDYAANFDLPQDPTRRDQALTLRRASAQLAVTIHSMTTPAQRAHATQKLSDLIRDFNELSQEQDLAPNVSPGPIGVKHSLQ